MLTPLIAAHPSGLAPTPGGLASAASGPPRAGCGPVHEGRAAGRRVFNSSRVKHGRTRASQPCDSKQGGSERFQACRAVNSPRTPMQDSEHRFGCRVGPHVCPRRARGMHRPTARDGRIWLRPPSGGPSGVHSVGSGGLFGPIRVQQRPERLLIRWLEVRILSRAPPR